MSFRMALSAAVLLAIAFLGIHRGLWTPDEPREAEISREMLLSPGVIPTLNGQQFVEKPPLYYWIVATAYRVAGAPSAAAARTVSALSATLTLLLLFLWGQRAHSRLAGLLAAVMLSSSVQFMVSTHWILIDPLLMLFTTAAAWSAWELLAGVDNAWVRAGWYAALALALWTKGLIGPVLVCAGVLAYALTERRARWRLLRPGLGVLVLAAALSLLVFALWKQGGTRALWEWAWVNHVQRLLNPGTTGHRQPLLYYCWTLPYALLPWLVPLIDALRPASWRRLAGGPSPQRYCVVASAAMLLVLSISATKREIYLLPVLPLLFLWLGMHAAGWWQNWRGITCAPLGALWWSQLALLCVFIVAPPALALIWLGRMDAVSLGVLIAGAAICVAALSASWRAQRERAGLLLLIGALAVPICVITLAPHLLNDMKDMAPFVASVGRRLPAGTPIYATSVDETLEAIVPFTTGRRLIAVDPARNAPEWLLVQDNHDGRALAPKADYKIEISQSFGPTRTLQLWHRRGPGMIGG